MEVNHSKSIMASYATFKELYNSEKYHNPYQILSEFIRYVIISKARHNFTSVEIQGDLFDEFGFNPPLSVVSKTLKNTSGVEKTEKKDCFKAIGIPDECHFRKLRKLSEERNRSIIDSLINYAHTQGIENLKEDRLAQSFIAFVLDEDGDSNYKKLIGEYIIKNEDNEEITKTISAIREGSILYSGLAFNFDEFGSLNKPITFFLDTEIIFNIVGLNGELYQSLAKDFLDLVRKANKGEKVIELRYFSEVRDEIDQFYSGAERILSGRGDVYQKPAMRAIIEGCRTPADVSEKKAELFRKLRFEYSIFMDEKENYYSKSDELYNLEGLKLENFPETEETNAEGFIFCSHINKLRRGRQTEDCLSSGYLFITDTVAVLKISNELRNRQKNEKSQEYCGYAASLSTITNKLWYKLNSGFGSKSFPQNLDVVIKARTILSSYISGEIAEHYDDIISKFKSGELTKEQAGCMITTLKNKAELPEALTPSNVEESLDFSDEYLARYEETLAQNKRHLQEKDRMISELSGNITALQKQLTEASNRNDEKEKEISALTERIKVIEEKENEKLRKKAKRRAFILFILSTIWKPVLFIAVVWSIWGICKAFGMDFPSWLGIVVSIGGIAKSFFLDFRKKLQEHSAKSNVDS